MRISAIGTRSQRVGSEWQSAAISRARNAFSGIAGPSVSLNRKDVISII